MSPRSSLLTPILTGETPVLPQAKERKRKKKWKHASSNIINNHYHTPGSCFTVITISRKTPIYSALVFSPSLLSYSLIGWLSATQGCNSPSVNSDLLLLFFVSHNWWTHRIKLTPVWVMGSIYNTNVSSVSFVFVLVVRTRKNKTQALSVSLRAIPK